MPKIGRRKRIHFGVVINEISFSGSFPTSTPFSDVHFSRCFLILSYFFLLHSDDLPCIIQCGYSLNILMYLLCKWMKMTFTWLVSCSLLSCSSSLSPVNTEQADSSCTPCKQDTSSLSSAGGQFVVRTVLVYIAALIHCHQIVVVHIRHSLIRG